MEKRLKIFARRLWPEIENASGLDYVSHLFDVIGFVYTTPLVLVGLGWLFAATDLALVRAEWPILGFLLVLLFVFEQLGFYFFIEIKPGTYSDWQTSLTPIIIWSAALIFGPSGLWLAVIHSLIYYIRRWRKFPSVERRWNCARNFTFNLVEVLTSLIAITLYANWAGSTAPKSAFPLPDLTLGSILPALLATFIWWLLPALVWVPFLFFFEHLRIFPLEKDSIKTYIRSWGIALGWPILAGPFAILAAGLYAQNGIGGYLFFISSLLLASLLAHTLSQAVERSQQRSRELENLEQLGRRLLNAPPDASTLPDVLEEQISNMFPLSSILIRIDRDPLFPSQILLSHLAQGALVPIDRLPVSELTWEWISTTTESRYFLPGEEFPWGEKPTSDALLIAPIVDVDSTETIGGIILSQSWRSETIPNLLPAAQSLAAQIASALHRARVYRIEQEMAVAGKIQASFLPDGIPTIPGWQLSVTLEPARSTSGDFYDFVPLPDGKFGILIADVADKGMGAALYMAASRTLIRTYATEYHTQPELALGAANRRIMADTRADLFVSVFYGILDSTAGTLTYCNAGHNPPYLVSAKNNIEVQRLTRTGIVLGVLEDATWEQRTIQLHPGDSLVLYTDGVTDAENGQGDFFGEHRLAEMVLAHRERSTQEMRDALMSEIHKFVGDAPQFDDITLMILKRDNELAG